MGVETPVTGIWDLNTAWPLPGESRREGDDHIRDVLKIAIKLTWPQVTGTINANHTEHNHLIGVTSAIQTQFNDITAVTDTLGALAFLDSVGAAQIDANAVGSSELANNAVDTNAIQNLAVTAGKIASNSITSAQLAANSVGASELANNSVAAANIIDGSVGSAEIATNAVTASEIATGAVGSSEIATGAVQQAEIANSAVGVGELKTTTQTWNIGGTSAAVITLNSGTSPVSVIQMNATSAGVPINLYTGQDGITFVPPDNGVTTGYVHRVSMRRTASTGSGDGRITYVTASPPYDLGDGEVAGFIFALMNSDGTIPLISSGEEAPWHNNGPTCIACEVKGKNKGEQFQKRWEGKTKYEILTFLKDPVTRAEGERLLGVTPDLVPITQAIKNADMDLIPHPFDVGAGQTAILLDPMSQLIHDFFLLGAEGQTELNSLIEQGHIIVDNMPIARKGPKGVPVHAIKWKLT